MFRTPLLRMVTGLVLQVGLGLPGPVEAETVPRFPGLPTAAWPGVPLDGARAAPAPVAAVVSSPDGGITISGSLGVASRLLPPVGGREWLASSRANAVSSADGGLALLGLMDAASSRAPLGDLPARNLIEQQLEVTLRSDGNASAN